MAEFITTSFGVPYEAKIPASWNIEFLLHPGSSTNKEAQQRMLSDIRRVAESHKVGLEKIKEAIDTDEKEQKENIEKSLKSLAELEKRGKAPGRQFRVFYWDGEEVMKANGVEYPVERDEDDDVIGYSVLVDDYEHGFSCRYETMGDFRKCFTDQGTPYHIAYFDAA